MATHKLKQLSPESLARAQRQRLAQEDGAKAMADVEKNAMAVRANMQRLRDLREAKEALKKSEPVIAKKKKVKRKTATER